MEGAPDARLSARAERAAIDRVIGIALELHGAAAIDRVIGIALELHGATLAGAHVESAGGGALLTRGGVDNGQPRRDLLGLNDVGDEFLDGVRAPGGRGRASARTDQLQEFSTIKIGHPIEKLRPSQ